VRRRRRSCGADRLWREYLKEGREIWPAAEADLLARLASVVVAEARLERGARLWGAAMARHEALGSFLPAATRENYEQETPLIRATLGEDVFAVALAEGRAMTTDESLQYALEEHSASLRLTNEEAPERLE
jgi:hypothetical protein